MTPRGTLEQDLFFNSPKHSQKAQKVVAPQPVQAPLLRQMVGSSLYQTGYQRRPSVRRNEEFPRLFPALLSMMYNLWRDSPNDDQPPSNTGNDRNIRVSGRSTHLTSFIRYRLRYHGDISSLGFGDQCLATLMPGSL